LTLLDAQRRRGGEDDVEDELRTHIGRFRHAEIERQGRMRQTQRLRGACCAVANWALALPIFDSIAIISERRSPCGSATSNTKN